MPGRGLELHLAGGEGLVLHRHGAVAAQHGDAQRLVPGVRLLVPLVHRRRIEGGDQGHLQRSVPLLLASQERVQDGPHALFLVLVLAADDVAERTHPPEELLIHQAGTAPAGQVSQVKVDRGARWGR